MNINEKLILVDADGVILDWFYSFNEWMKFHGYPVVVKDEYRVEATFAMSRDQVRPMVRHFNESGRIEFIPPFRDAMKYVKKLHEEHGFIFHCITSLSNDPFAANLRRRNIHALFGETAFEKIICLDTGADKDEALAEYKDSGCFWVEDKAENAEVGYNLGLSSILMAHGHNKDFLNKNIPVVQNWKEIYEMVI